MDYTYLNLENKCRQNDPFLNVLDDKEKMDDFEWRKLLRISSLSSTPLFDFVYGVHVAPMFLIFSFLPSALANGFAQFAQSFKIVLISPVFNLPGENEDRSKNKKG